MHVGIIMDGNGRWAVSIGKSRYYGHRTGASRVSDIVRCCPDLGIKTLTLYAFSTENWKRSAHEVQSLMRLFRVYLQSKYLVLVENNIKVNFLGDLQPIAPDISYQMRKLEKDTQLNNGLILNIAINYGGRNDITRAIQKVAKAVVNRELEISNISEEKFETYLDTAFQCSPDLIIRTAGEKRLSNFLTWQSAYSELYFSQLAWPEFFPRDLAAAITEFRSRNRSYGNVERSTDLPKRRSKLS